MTNRPSPLLPSRVDSTEARQSWKQMLGESLSEKLKSDGTIYEFVGLGKDEQDNECLFVYIRPREVKNLHQAPQKWLGLSVKYFQLESHLKEIVQR
jgi:hypothetical protein